MSLWVPLLAGLLLAGAELAFAQLHRPRPPLAAAAGRAALAGTAGVFVAALVALAASIHIGRSLPVTIAGTAAVVSITILLRR